MGYHQGMIKDQTICCLKMHTNEIPIRCSPGPRWSLLLTDAHTLGPFSMYMIIQHHYSNDQRL